MRPFALLLLTIPCLLTGPSAFGETAGHSRCSAGGAEDRVSCLKARMCPDARSDAELARCYRAVAIELAGGQSIADETSGSVAVDAAPAVPATNVYAPALQPAEALPEPSEHAAGAAVPGAPPAPAPAPAVAAEPAVAARPESMPAPETDDFGLPPEPVKTKKKKEPKSVSGVIVMLERQPSGSFLIGLDNGQLWEENEPTRVVLEVDQTVKITRGFMGSYKLIPDQGRSTAVHRLNCRGNEPDARCALLANAVDEAS